MLGVIIQNILAWNALLLSEKAEPFSL